MKIASRTILSAAIAALLCPMVAPPARAQRAIPPIGGIDILVRNIDDKSDAVRLASGGTVNLPEGVHVRVNVEAVPANGSRTPIYPNTVFTDLNRSGIQILRANPANAAVDLMILPIRGSSRRIQRIGYKINESYVPARLREGTINIQVVPNGNASLPPATGGNGGHGDHGGHGWGDDKARDLTRVLYQGILMRDLDPGARGTVDAIRNGGYNALIDSAVSIANSNESRFAIPGRGVTMEQRLQAMYQSLLGLAPNQVDPGSWRSDLQTLNNGHIAQVVENIVRSDRFRSRYSLGQY
jgi:hypothetical protein